MWGAVPAKFRFRIRLGVEIVIMAISEFALPQLQFLSSGAEEELHWDSAPQSPALFAFARASKHMSTERTHACFKALHDHTGREAIA